MSTSPKRKFERNLLLEDVKKKKIFDTQEWRDFVAEKLPLQFADKKKARIFERDFVEGDRIKRMKANDGINQEKHLYIDELESKKRKRNVPVQVYHSLQPPPQYNSFQFWRVKPDLL